MPSRTVVLLVELIHVFMTYMYKSGLLHTCTCTPITHCHLCG